MTVQGDRDARPEFEVLLATAGEAPRAADWDRLVDRELDWEHIVEQAIAHGIGTRLFHSLAGRCESAKGRCSMLPDAWRRIEEHYFSVIALNLPRLEQLVDILAALGRARVKAVAFKGPLLETTLGRDPLERESTDLDILVSRDSLARAFEALSALGYLPLEDDRRQRDSKGQPLQKHYVFEPDIQALAKVELHAEVMEPEWAVDLPTHQLLEGAQPIDFRGASLHTLCAEDLLLALSVHGTSHAWRRLMWLSDLAGLLGRLSETSLSTTLARARRIGCERIVVASCSLAGKLLMERTPEAISEAVRRDRRAKRLAVRWARNLANPLGGSQPMRLPIKDQWLVRERRRDALTSAMLHGRMAWFYLADRLSPLRFGDGASPARMNAQR